MRTPDELDQLLNDVLSPETSEDIRTTTLDQGLTALRQRKRKRVLIQRVGVCTAAASVLIALVVSLTPPTEKPSTSVAAVSPAPVDKTVPGTNIRIISDEELFALFPDRPLALVGPKGHQELIFLDEKPVATQ